MVDVALISVVGDLDPPSAKEVARVLIPEGAAPNMQEHLRQAPDITLPIVDSLVSFTHATPSTAESSFDSTGRSSTARVAEGIRSLLKAERRIVDDRPELLEIVLHTAVVAKDTHAVPGSSRGLFAETVSASHLLEVIRETEGALSYALVAMEDVPLSWHQTTVQMLKTGSTGEDLLQRILHDLQLRSSGPGGDVSARVFRDVLARHLRQSGAGEVESEIWLSYAMSCAEKGIVQF